MMDVFLPNIVIEELVQKNVNVEMVSLNAMLQQNISVLLKHVIKKIQ